MIYDAGTLSWVPWDGSLSTSSVTIGKVNQGSGGASAWKVDGSAVTQPVSGPLTSTELRATPLYVTLDGPQLGPFGDIITAEHTPVLQLDFVHGINTQMGTTSVVTTGVVDTNAARLRVQTGTGAAGAAVYMSRRSAKYRAGQGMTARFTYAWTTGVTNSTQIVGSGTSTNGYFFGFNGATFGILHRNNGSDTWIEQSSWNGDTCNGAGASTFDWIKTNGNVMQIRYPYLGYGNITFWVQNAATSRWILCHTIRYANSTNATQLSNPNVGFYANVVNTGNTSNLIGYVGSVGFFIVGARSFVGNPKWATDNNKAAVTAETNILSIRNATTYNGVTNRGLIRLNSLSAGAQNNTGIGICRIRIGATVGGSPSFAPVNGSTADNGVTVTSGNSIASVDTAGTTATGGTLIYNLTFANPGNTTIDLTPFDLYVAPGEVATVSITSTASATVAAALNWTDDI